MRPVGGCRAVGLLFVGLLLLNGGLPSFGQSPDDEEAVNVENLVEEGSGGPLVSPSSPYSDDEDLAGGGEPSGDGEGGEAVVPVKTETPGVPPSSSRGRPLPPEGTSPRKPPVPPPTSSHGAEVKPGEEEGETEAASEGLSPGVLAGVIVAVVVVLVIIIVAIILVKRRRARRREEKRNEQARLQQDLARGK